MSRTKINYVISSLLFAVMECEVFRYRFQPQINRNLTANSVVHHLLAESKPEGRKCKTAGVSC